MKQFLRVDEEGYYIEPVLLDTIFNSEGLEIYFPEDYIEHILEEEQPEDLQEFLKDYSLPKANCEAPKERMIDTPFTDGMYKPRWNGTEWIDEITQEELDERKLQSRLEWEQEILENPTEQMILGRQLSDVELDNMVLEQQVGLLTQQNMMLANLVTDMELKMIEQINDSESDENV